MKRNMILRRYRGPLFVVGTLAFLGYTIWSARTPGQPRTVKDFVFIMELLGVPFVIFAYIVWSSTNWGGATGQAVRDTLRGRLALAGSVMGGASAVMLLLFLPLWDTAVHHRNLQELWMFAGVLMALAATGCGVLGAPKLRRPALASVLLLPFWLFLAALLLKASLD